ncbi:MAG: Rieske 2Fe-2S domain-containing protein [Candidatus Nanopelagicales bacterium]
MSNIENHETGNEVVPVAQTNTEVNLPKTELPVHVLRRADVDPIAAARAERQVAIMFLLSALFTVLATVAFFAIPVDRFIRVPGPGVTQASNFVLGITLGLAIFLIGAGAIHWARKLMPDDEVVQSRHGYSSSKEIRESVMQEIREGGVESGFATRKIVRRSLLTAMAVLPLPAVVLALDFGPLPKNELRETLWAKGVRLVTDPTGRYLRPEDFSVGSLVSAHPENLHEWEEENHNLNARAKTSILVVRMTPEQLRTMQGEGWDYQGIVAFSKICTHVGCPIALYEHRTHHLLCPCHQSTFDLADSGNVVFGPAARRLPQLPISVDEEGYLIAVSDFQEPVGPSFWERG